MQVPEHGVKGALWKHDLELGSMLSVDKDWHPGEGFWVFKTIRSFQADEWAIQRKHQSVFVEDWVCDERCIQNAILYIQWLFLFE